MDEALAGHADWIEVELAADSFVHRLPTMARGMPVDLHQGSRTSRRLRR